MFPLSKHSSYLPKWLFTESHSTFTIVFINNLGYNGKSFKHDLVS